jgi:hypothetical protein
MFWPTIKTYSIVLFKYLIAGMKILCQFYINTRRYVMP